MTVTVPLLGAHLSGVAACLNARFATINPAVPLGVGRKLDDTTAAAYAVLWPLPSTFDGPVADYSANLAYGFQVTSVGSTVEAAEFVADLARTALLADGVTVTGRFVNPVIATGGQAVQRDDDIKPPAYYRADTYRMDTSPA